MVPSHRLSSRGLHGGDGQPGIRDEKLRQEEGLRTRDAGRREQRQTQKGMRLGQARSA